MFELFTSTGRDLDNSISFSASTVKEYCEWAAKHLKIICLPWGSSLNRSWTWWICTELVGYTLCHSLTAHSYQKNRGKWKKRRVMRHVRGRDGVTLLHKGHHIERPLSLVCRLEIKGPVATEDATLQLTPGSQKAEAPRSRRQAAETAREKIRLIAADEDDDWTLSSSSSHFKLRLCFGKN